MTYEDALEFARTNRGVHVSDESMAQALKGFADSLVGDEANEAAQPVGKQVVLA
jgi:hypothetical protein